MDQKFLSRIRVTIKNTWILIVLMYVPMKLSFNIYATSETLQI